jgi:hypothetical protein
VDQDAAALAAAAAPHVLAAIAAYGAAVASRVEDASASATVKLGGRLLRRVMDREGSARAVQQAVGEVAELPEDEDRVAVLRAELRRALQADTELATDVARLLSEAGVAVSASGPRSVAVRDNSGIVQTGDGSAAWQGPNPR